MTPFLLAILVLIATPAIAQAKKLDNVSDYELWVAFGFSHSRSVDTYSDPNEGLHAKGWFKLKPRWSLDILEGYTYVRVVAVTKRGHYAIAPQQAMATMYFPCTGGEGFDDDVRVASRFSGNAKTRDRIVRAGKEAKLFFPLKAFYSTDYRAYVCLGNQDALRDVERELRRP